MIDSNSSRRLAVAGMLGLLLLPSLQDTSHAEGAQPSIVGRNTAADSDSVPGPATAEQAGVATLTLAWFDVAGIPELVNTAMQRHVEEIFAAIDVTIEWYEPSSVSTGDEEDAGYYLKVMLFDKDPAKMGHAASAMGVCIATDVPPDAVLMFDPTILRNLSGGTMARPLSPDELGRAYGKVLAHEVIHAVANDQRHAKSGLMAPNQNRHALVSRAVNVDEESAAAFHRGLQHIHTVVAERASGS